MLWKCVQFAQDAVSGLALLELAGVNSGQPPQVYDWGGGAYTVCQIDRQPTSVPDRCFSPMSGPNWSDWYGSSGRWIQRNTGVTGYSVRDGDMEGWTYTSGFGAAPPVTSYSQVCPAQPTAAATSTGGHATTAPAGAPAATASSPSTTTPESTATSNFQALAPTVSPTPRLALTETGPLKPPSSSRPSGIWLLLGASAALLVGLLAFNLLRRGP